MIYIIKICFSVINSNVTIIILFNHLFYFLQSFYQMIKKLMTANLKKIISGKKVNSFFNMTEIGC